MKQADMNRQDVQAFHCGTEPHEEEMSDWIRLHSAAQISSGYKVWLYRLESNEGPLVGYGSLSTGKIKTTEADNSEREIRAFQIPMLALHRDYWGKPKGVKSLEEKFSRQIVRHLQDAAKEAQKKGDRERLLGLYVHPLAEQAQQLYVDCGFKFAPKRFLPHRDIPPEMADGLFGMDFRW